MWTGNLTTLGPSPRSQHSNWFPLGSDLPHQGQASDRHELCRILYTFGTIFHDSLHICIYATSSHILTHNVKTCYTDYVLSRPIYAYLHHQSDILRHDGTNYEELLFSSDM